MTTGFLGIDAGTQGLTVIFCNEELEVIAVGEGGYSMVGGLDAGCYEQTPESWENALAQAMQHLKEALPSGINMETLGIGISGQMHGEVLSSVDGTSMGTCRLWCDSRNEEEGDELTQRFGVKMPKRITAARWLWTIRHQPDRAEKTRRITTPAGWLAYRLTGEFNLGIGDASGMFPIDQDSLDYRQDLLDSFDELVHDRNLPDLRSLLPTVKTAGQDAAVVNDAGASLFGIAPGIPVAPAEGDQPASLAGSLIGEAGMVSVSFGTSVCANSVGDRMFTGVSPAVDHFCAPDGKPINMVWLRNGTTYMNTLVEMYGAISGGDRAQGFANIMPEVVKATPDCGGLLALPFMDDEPGLGVSHGGTAMVVGLNEENSTAGNVVKAALLSTMFNLRSGSEVLDQQGFPRTEIVLSGGLTKTPELSQVLADVFDAKVSLLQSAEEGCAWGAALMAKYRYLVMQGSSKTWAEFLADQPSAGRQCFDPRSQEVEQYERVYARYKNLMQVQGDLESNLAPT